MKRTELPRAEALCAQYLNKARACSPPCPAVQTRCLLYFLREQGCDVSCAHFNHRLRGEEAVRDEEFVRAWCEEEDPLLLGFRRCARPCAQNGQDRGRGCARLRYAFLRETAKKLNAQLTLAHHADDNAETVLFEPRPRNGSARPLRHAAKAGRSRSSVSEQTRAELAAYAHSHNIPHVEDRTNADPNAAARGTSCALRSCRGFKRSTPRRRAHRRNGALARLARRFDRAAGRGSPRRRRAK